MSDRPVPRSYWVRPGSLLAGEYPRLGAWMGTRFERYRAVGVTEFFDRHSDYGTEWITVTTILEDPQYLTQSFITTTHFKREADGGKRDQHGQRAATVQA